MRLHPTSLHMHPSSLGRGLAALEPAVAVLNEHLARSRTDLSFCALIHQGQCSVILADAHSGARLRHLSASDAELLARSIEQLRIATARALSARSA